MLFFISIITGSAPTAAPTAAATGTSATTSKSIIGKQPLFLVCIMIRHVWLLVSI